MNVQVIRLKTGEDLIVDVVNKDINTGSITVKDPFIIFMPQPGRIGILPFLAYCNLSAGLTIQADDIMWQCKAEKEVEDQYRTTITGIVVPSTVSGAAGKAGGLKFTT